MTTENTTEDAPPAEHPLHPFLVQVRTLAGHRLAEHVTGAELVAALTTEAVSEFVRRHQLEAGDYALTLPRLGSTSALDPTATLAEAGVQPHDELVLISRAPHVDG